MRRVGYQDFLQTILNPGQEEHEPVNSPTFSLT